MCIIYSDGSVVQFVAGSVRDVARVSHAEFSCDADLPCLWQFCSIVVFVFPFLHGHDIKFVTHTSWC